MSTPATRRAARALSPVQKRERAALRAERRTRLANLRVDLEAERRDLRAGASATSERVREVYREWREFGWNHHKALSATAKTCAIRCRDARPLVVDIRAEFAAHRAVKGDAFTSTI